MTDTEAYAAMEATDDRGVPLRCPLCRNDVWVLKGVIARHTTGVAVGDWGFPVRCMASGTTQARAELLEAQMRRRAHP